ncbi:helix-hairpin-helix domain-containing protein [Kribbella sp. CA-294648]|uniref:helix-hairpin-helix domain-containing protein n=1 Tax=Kribbella sp. CA-294648 TaxID=3239948 RepID=UPI003D8E3FD7
MKLSRRPPPPDPEARQQALSRLRAASHPPDPDEVRGGWTPSPALPDRLKGPLWTLSPRHVVVLALVLLVGLAWAAYALLRTNPEPIPNSPSTLTSGSPVAIPTPGATPGGNGPGNGTGGPGAPGGAGSPGKPATVVVHVAGKVRRPGLVRASTGSRVADVLAAAGGALPGVDLTTLNLARPVTDGEQIVVGVPGAAPPSSPAAGQPTGTPGTPASTPLDLNTATLAQLDSLPGVGPVLAQRILDWRTEHGRFTSPDELQEVPGVGPKKFESLKPHVRV